MRTNDTSAGDYSRLVLELSTSVELKSYICSAPSLAAYLIVGFLHDKVKLVAFIVSLVVTVCLTYAAGIAVRRVRLSPYAAWIRSGKRAGSEAEAARAALLGVPGIEGLSIFLRWAVIAPIVLAAGPLFGVDYGAPFAIFASIACALSGALAMPASFLGSELAISSHLNAPILSDAKAKPRFRMSLRLRLALAVSIMVDYLAAMVILNMVYLGKGYLDQSGSMIGLVLLVVGTLAMTVAIMRLFDKDLSATLREINRKLKAMNEDSGDLTARLPIVAQDEVGDLSANFNGLMGFLRSSISEVRGSAREGRSVGSELAATAEETSAASTQISASMEGLKKRTEGLRTASSGQRQALGAAGEALKSFIAKMDEQASAVEESSAAINQMMANLASIEASTNDKRRLVAALRSDGAEGDKAVEGITGLVAEVARSAQAISGLVDVIGDISQRTSLLAMNAAIEAAHSGQAGRGFAIIAGEVKKLAASQAERASRIKGIVAGIQASVDAGSRDAESVRSSLREIASGSAQAAERLELVRRATEEQKRASEEISSSMEALAAASASIREEAGRQAQYSERVRGAVASIAEAATQARESALAIAQESAGLATAVNGLRELTARGGELTAALSGWKGKGA